MRKATRIVASSFGILAGIAGLEHGYFETLQGNTRPPTFMFASMGTPCMPEKVWNACEPAMTILPNLLAAGILTAILSLMVMIWSAVFVQRKNGGGVLILLSVFLLLAGGGFFPPLIGIVGGFAGTRINKPLGGMSAVGLLRFVGKLWPWPLVIFIGWLLGQFPVGYFFNDYLQSIEGFSLLMIVALLPVSVFTGYAYDVHSTPATGK